MNCMPWGPLQIHQPVRRRIDIPVQNTVMNMIDPPWRYETWSEAGKGKSAEQHYDCMSLDDIFALDITSQANPAGSWFWLWATAPMYDAARACFEKWGVKYVTQGVWVKMVKDNSRPTFGTGYVFRNAHEPYLIGKIGKPKVCNRSIRSVILAPRREHSRKPDEAYRDAELLAGPGPKADIFSREARPGWTAWGNETSKFSRVGEPGSTTAATQTASL